MTTTSLKEGLVEGKFLKSKRLSGSTNTRMVVSVVDKKRQLSSKIDQTTRRRRTRQTKSARRRGISKETLERQSNKPSYFPLTGSFLSGMACSQITKATPSIGMVYSTEETTRLLNNRLFATDGLDSECKSMELCTKSYLEDDNNISSTDDRLLTDKAALSNEDLQVRRKRWWRTAQTLRQSGLLSITMKTAELLRKNQQIQREIESLQEETKSFVLSVMSNPENNSLVQNFHSNSQLYELLVPGSQSIMSVSTSSLTNPSSSTHSFSDSCTNISGDLAFDIPSPSSLYSDPSSPISSPNTGSCSNSSDEENLQSTKSSV